MNRVTSFSASNLMLSDLADGQRALNRAQEQIASGKKVQKASDGPAEAVASLDSRARLRRSEQLDRNAGTARQWLTASDGATQTVIDGISAARSLVIQANSASGDANSRAAIAGQLMSLRQSLLGAANTAVLGRPIFAGTAAGQVAYDTSGAYAGDAGSVQLPVANGVTLQVTRTGPEVFGTTNPADPANGDLFQVLSSLAQSVQSGDTAAMTAGLSHLDTATNRVQVVQVELGSRLNQIDDLRAAASANDTELKSAISGLEDIDYAEAAIAYKSHEASYQAALQVTARIIQQSLLDFLR